MRLIKLLGVVIVCLTTFGCRKRDMVTVPERGTEVKELRHGPPASALTWFKGTELVELKSSHFNCSQSAYYYKARSPRQPLVVSLHTWGMNYEQEDPLAQVAIAHNWNYIHPDYGGPQWLARSCCYPESVQDIDDAATFAVQNGADPNRIAFIGKSGGGTGVLAAYLKSKYSCAWYLAWSPIPDQVSWHDEVLKDPDLKRRYLQKILEGTKSTENSFNFKEAKLKSPSYFDFSKANYPQDKKLRIYAGIRDGLDGWSTSLSQPLTFYNKLLANLPAAPEEASISKTEFSTLVNERHGVNDNALGSVGSKKVVFRKRYKNIELVVFSGGHEIVDSQAGKDLEQAFQK